MKENESAGPEQSTPVEAETEVFKGFRAAGLDEMQALRTTQAVRVQAGQNIKETLEVHQGKMDIKVDGAESRLTTKVDRVDAKVDRVDAKVDRVDAKVDGVTSELKVIKRELTFYRWLMIILLALLTLMAALGLLPKLDNWLGRDSTPVQSVQAPAEADPPETALPPEADPSEPSPE